MHKTAYTVNSGFKGYNLKCVHTTSIDTILINTKSQYLQLRGFGLYLPLHLLMS